MSSASTETRIELRNAIAREKRDLQQALSELAGVAKSRVSLGQNMSRHPMVWLWGAFGLGMFLGVRR